MEVVLILLGLGLFFSPVIAVLVFRRKLKDLDERYRRLEERLSIFEKNGTKLSASDSSGVEEPFIPESSPDVPLDKSGRKKRSGSEIKPHPLPPVLKKLEKQFLDNWTGILGAVIIVVGVGFLSLYAALNMGEFARFLLLLFLAAIPAGLFYYLKDSEKWVRQASWFRSISGAIFLFACLGSGGIPGLQWIHNPFQSLGLLMLGIVVNLGLSSLGGKQYFASFHTLLSLLALIVIPPGTTTLVVAALICLYAIIQTYKVCWDLHLLLTITGFFAYHLFWMTSLQKDGFSDLARFQGAGAVVLIFMAAAMIHYRKNYATGRFELFPFLVHLANWAYFSAGMILYIGEYQWRTVPLIAAALAAMVLAGMAEKKDIKWLRTTDYMIMQILVLAALFTLKGWDVQNYMIWGLIFAETTIFTRTMLVQNYHLLFRIGVNIGYLSSLVLTVLAFDASPGEYAAVLIPAAALVLTVFNHRLFYHQDDSRWILGDTLPGMGRNNKEFALSGIFMAVLGCAVLAALQEVKLPAGFEILPAAPLLILVLWSRKESPSRGMSWGAVLFLSVFVLTGWEQLLRLNSPGEHLLTGLALLSSTVAGGSFLKGGDKKLTGPVFAWLLMTGSILFLSYALLNPLSAILPGILWLSLSAGLAVALPVPRIVRQMGLIFLASYLLRHFMVHIHLEEQWVGIPVKYLLDVLPLPVLILWYRQKGKWMPLLLELTLVFSVAVVLIELPLIWIPAALEGLALIALFTGCIGQAHSRLRIYSLLLNWVSLVLLITVVFVQSDNPLFPLAGALSLLLGLAYLVLSYRHASFETLETPRILPWLKKVCGEIQKSFHALLLYPIFLACAFFIFHTAAAEIRTFFWALECFLLYGASLFLGEEHFRTISQGGLFFCVIRLVFVDMSGSTPLIRGLVFLGVGMMMLGVNILYNRFKERFQKE
ncbi:MAG: hypothetical protein B6241_08700 [Spirochaetaceae bacterium 4572_59]|nr:MAG: hypothetical protein B6241_08700 [Spirochaetaceae bacterium 4572_59]